ncbi:MAG: type II secretion system ATPase GspE [Planctomycetes bacterium]|nr:type II secretion system ATPase GspE [Planctomycetota bacterium]MBI3834072.1 type II secretion system ATPase GspE [Planctomycetota bacterium]
MTSALNIGDVLQQRKLITAAQLKQAKTARKPTERLEQCLVRLGFINERDYLNIYSEQLSIPFVEITELKIDPELLKQTPSKVVHRDRVIPIDRENGTIRVATSNPFNLYAFDELRMLMGAKIETVLATSDEISRVIKQHYGVGGHTVEAMIGDAGAGIEVIGDVDADNADLIEQAQEATVVKLVNEILLEAIRDRASDVHIEPFEHDLKIRYRIDGVLHTTNVPPEIRRFHSAIISRIKILSNLNIAEKRLPQDGGFKIKAQNRDIDLRVSIIPTAFGGAVVMRILDKQSVLLSLGQLGLMDEALAGVEALIHQPYGIILVTGPTGSGKTTTLYAALNTIRSDEIKILTVEDPIEYYLDGIQQVQIKPHIGLTFASGLRSFLRHDPDVILVGEIRDLETAEVAINASLTGHLVFSTLHTNDAVTATTRLLDMGVEPFLVSSSISGVLAQRLVRQICKHCREEFTPAKSELPTDMKIEPGQKFFRGAGCRDCRNSGYRGRLGIFEMLTIDDEMRNLIVQRKSATDILAVARRKGLKVMREDGFTKVIKGMTTIDEIVRVTKINVEALS